MTPGAFFARCAFFAIAILTGRAAVAGESAHHWSYSGAEGPAHWGATCAAGHAQSPVDIVPAKAVSEKLPPLQFDYRPAELRIIDNGHSVQVNVPPGSSLTVGGHRYQLVQFHFHKPSEETIGGKHFDMVAHLVHRDAEGHLAVVAIPLQAGAANSLVATLWSHLPREKQHEVAVSGTNIDATGLLPQALGYYTYPGSLTTPPCTEGVRWFVLKSPVSVSRGEIAAFGKLYAANARPLQPLNARKVLVTQ